VQTRLIYFLATTFLSTFAYSVTWSAPTTIYDKGCKLNTLHIDIDSTGDEFALWNEENSLFSQIQYTDETTGSWSDPDQVNYNLRWKKILDFSINSKLMGMLISGGDGDPQTILANQLSAPSTWEKTVVLSESVNYSFGAKVSTNSDGDSAASWIENYGTGNLIGSAVFSGGSWSEATFLSTMYENSFNPCIGIDASGNVVVAWTETEGSATRVKTTKYVSGSWQAVETVSGATNDALYPDLAVNASGDALLVWAEYTATQNLHICAAKLTSGTWGSPVSVATPNYISQFPIVAIDATGNGCCVWNESDGSNSRVKASIYSSGSWQTPTFISNAGQTAYKAKLASDDAGNFVCIWPEKNDSNETLYAGTYEGSWSSVETLSAAGKTVNTYDLGINEGGDIIVSYLSTDSSSSTIEIKTASF